MRDAAEDAVAPGPLLQLRLGGLRVDVAPQAGGRLAQVVHEDHPWLVTADEVDAVGIAWGCYPMLPWAGRIRDGQFLHDGQRIALPRTLGGHAIHGVGYNQPWRVEHARADACVLSLALPEDARWPFGGLAVQEIALERDVLRLSLRVTAGARGMPRPVLGWHPWLRKPDALEFHPDAMYPRDAQGIATLPLQRVTPPPWDDCFIQRGLVVVRRDRRVLTLTSDCAHWVVYDIPDHATCIEPQTGPPDAFNLCPGTLPPGGEVSAWFEWRFSA